MTDAHEPSAQVSPEDPTPVLSTIGQINATTWGDDHVRLVRLQSIAVAWNFEFFTVAIIAAIMPWVLGRSGVVWSVVLTASLLLAGFMSGRFVRKRHVVVKAVVTEANRTQSRIRITLWVTIIAVQALGIGRAFSSGPEPYIMVAISVPLGVALAVAILAYNKRRYFGAQSGDAAPHAPSPGDETA